MLVETEIPATRSCLDQARAGDAEAFSEICRLHETRLLRQAVSLCGNLALAEDLTQDTLVEAWKNLHRYNGRCQFFTWLCAILLNRYRNVRRRNWFRSMFPAGPREEDDGENHTGNLPDPAAPPDQAAELREQARLIWQCVRSLPHRHRQVIYLRFYVDDSLEGMAAALGCSPGTVKSRLYHALEKLRKMNARMNDLGARPSVFTKTGGRL